MNNRQFLWGLSNGVTMLAIAGAFWVGLGIATVAARVHWLVPAVGTVVQVSGGVALVWAAARLRRKSGFQRSELRLHDGRNKMEARHILTWLFWTVVGQTALIGLAVWLCLRMHSERMIWPSIGLVVSLHLVPLAKIFHVRPYYGTAVAGSLVSLAGFAISTSAYAVAWLGGGMAAVMWLSAVYLLAHVDRITDRALRETWAA